MTTSRLLIIAAPSGGGKTTLCRRLLNDFSGHLKLSISCTTRSPRGSEKNGVEYFFLSKEEFEKKISENRFAEWANVHGNFYGTSKEFIEETFKNGNSVLLDIDIQGASQLKKAYPKQCLSIFIAPPSLEVLEKRLRARGTDSEETILKRIANAKYELAHQDQFDLVVVNDDLEKAYQELSRFIKERVIGES